MNYIERYIKRLDDKGNNKTEALFNKTKFIINNKFDTSPSFTVVKVNDIDTDSIVNNETKYNEKSIIFRPDTLFDIGSVVEYKNRKYLLMSFIDDEIYPKGEIQLCNSTFPIKEKDKKIFIGYDDLKRPVYETIYGETVDIPCVVSMNEATISIADTNKPINLLNNIVYITIPYTESESIGYDKEFEMYSSIYRIIRIDISKSINKVGLTKITAEVKGFKKGDNNE